MGQRKGIEDMLGRHGKWIKGRALAIAAVAAAALAGCSSLPNYANPIEWYRDATGASKNDDETTERNTQNLEEGGQRPYPSVGSVPKPPDRAMSTADRKKLAQGLADDRSNARSSDAELRAGQPVPPVDGSLQPLATAPAVVATPGLASSPATADAGARPLHHSRSTAVAAAGPAPKPPRRKPPVRGSEAPPPESPLGSPTIASLPEGDATKAPPPAPDLTPRKAPPAPVQQAATPAPKSPPSAPDLPVSPAATPTPPPGEPAAAPPAPPTPPPGQPAAAPPPPPPPTQTAIATPAATATRRPGKVSKQVAEIEFVKGETRLTAEDNQRLPAVLRLYQANGGTVRVVGYGRRGYGPDAAQQELQSYSKAIDRANAVAQALTKLGVPPSSIVVQAAPVGDGLGEDRAEVLLEY
jgi:outer membrane protein OmpA-like peptidoglycan-associated protein